MRALFILPLLLLLPACGDSQKDAANSAALDAPIPDGAPTPSGSASTPVLNATSALRQQATIDTPGTLPAAFRGQWAGTTEDCGNRRSDLHLSLGPREMRFYESLGTVTAVEQAGADAIIVDASYEGEGQTWSRRQKLSLSADGTLLTVANQGNSIVRKRCTITP
ncbi:hypothetical protein BH10PSE12_BH10PSE12_36250 [soil metagenome]